jgi:hypothetical protein
LDSSYDSLISPRPAGQDALDNRRGRSVGIREDIHASYDRNRARLSGGQQRGRAERHSGARGPQSHCVHRHGTPPGQDPDPWRPDSAWFAFDYLELEPPYRPDSYTASAEAADAAGYSVILIDSGSHEWAGEGGVLEWHEEEQEDSAQRRAQRYNRAPNYSDYEAVKMQAWIKPKTAHKKMVGKLTTLRAHLLIGLRAEQKVQFVQEYDDKGEKVGKEKIVAAKDLPPKERWFPVCEKGFPFELGISFVLTPDEPGVPYFIKLQDQHRPFVEMGRPLSLETGRKLAAWSSGALAPGAGQPAKKASNGDKVSRTPEQLTEGYIAGLKAPPSGKVATLEELAAYQRSASKFLGALQAQAPALWERCTEANAARFEELSASSDPEPSESSAKEPAGQSADAGSLPVDPSDLFGESSK